MMSTLRPGFWVLVTALVATAACGDDDDVDTDDGRGGSSSAGESSAGSTSKAGKGGSATSGGTGGTASGGVSGGAGEPTSAGAAGDTASGGAGGSDGGAAGAAGAGGAAADLTDAQVLLVLDTLNQGEIEAAYAALPRLANPDVQDFAQLMIDDHSSGRQAVVALANSLDVNPEPSDVQRALKAKGEAMAESLRDSEAETLDQPYMSTQVAAHAEALSLLAELEATSDAAALQDLIGMLQMTVEEHHDQAMTIEASLP